MVERPDSIHGSTTEIMTGCGKLYVTINEHESGFKEVRLSLGKTGGCQAAGMEAVGQLITFAWTAKVSRKKIIQALRGIQCPNPTVSGGVRTLSCYDAIAVVMEAAGKPLGTVNTDLPASYELTSPTPALEGVDVPIV